MPSITLSSKGQVTLPSEIRSHLGLHAGDRLMAVEMDGAVVLRPMPYKSFLEACEASPGLSKGKTLPLKAMKDAGAEAALDRFERASKR